MSDTVTENTVPPPFQPAAPVQIPAQQGAAQDALAAALPPAWDPTSRTVPVIQLSKEDLVLRTYFNDNVIGPKLRAYMNPKMFVDPVNQALTKVIGKFEKKYSRSPTAQELILGMGSTGFSEQLVQKLGYICNTPMVGVRQEYLIDLIEGHFRERMTENILISAAENVHDRHVDGINNLIPKLKEAVNFSLHTNLGLNVYNDIGAALALLKERKECIPSSINEIRAKTGTVEKDGSIRGGGYYRKTLTLFVGQPNVGKTLVLCSESCYAVRAGYNVMYISLELSEEYLWRRMAANLTGIDQYEVTELSTEECKAKIEAARLSSVEKMGRLKIKRMKTTTTPYEIDALLDEYETEVGAPADMLVIDYIGIMKPNQRPGMIENMYKDGQAKAEQIREIWYEVGIVIKDNSLCWRTIGREFR